MEDLNAVESEAADSAERYAEGYRDGCAQASADVDFNRGRVSFTLAELSHEIRDAYLHAGRRTRVYVLGYARGYRHTTWEVTHDAQPSRRS